MIEILGRGCGTAFDKALVAGNVIKLEMRHEPMTRADWTTHDYNVHFCVGLRNTALQDIAVELEVEGGTWSDLPPITPLIYVSTGPDGPFSPFTGEARTDLKKKYALKLNIPAGTSIYVANTMPRTHQEELSRAATAGAASRAAKVVYGQSLQGRDLVAWTIGDVKSKPVLLVTSGFHAPEPDTLASIAILRALSLPEFDRISQQYAIAIVPVANPDGYAIGSQGSNAEDINLYWHFAKETPTRCPEAAKLWEFAHALEPVGYIDFHSYTFQLRKDAGPYLKPLWYYADPRVRAAAAALERRVVGDLRLKPVRTFSAFAPHTLGAMLTEAFDTLTMAKYHIHLKDGVEACEAQAVDVFTALADALASNGVTSRPKAGPSGTTLHLRKRITEIWAGCVRPAFGELRRGNFSRIRFDRTGLDLPAEVS